MISTLLSEIPTNYQMQAIDEIRWLFCPSFLKRRVLEEAITTVVSRPKLVLSAETSEEFRVDRRSD
jgi:hypothetical protein